MVARLDAMAKTPLPFGMKAPENAPANDGDAANTAPEDARKPEEPEAAKPETTDEKPKP
jgi:hypothetical protein